ncbi:MAG: ABC transporter ATP-binding protein [Clostridia bacterium]|nr:ABC transporter ATP-binding protein [Clostridia bacterium]
MKKNENEAVKEEKKKKKLFGRKNTKEEEKKIPENETPEEKEKREKEEKEKEEARKKREEAKKKAKPKDLKQATKRLFSYLNDFKGLIIVVCISVVLTAVTSFVASLTMMPVINTIADTVAAENPDISAALSTVVKWLIIMAAGFIVSSSLNLIYTRIMLYVSSKTLANMRRDLFNHLQTLPLSFFDGKRTGEIMSRFTNDISRVSDLVSNTLPTLITSTISAVLTIGFMVITSWKLTLTITVAVVLMFMTVFVITKKCSPLFKEQQKAIGEVNGYIEEYIRGIKNVKLFCHEEKTKEDFSELNENYRKIGVRANIIGGFMSPLMSMITRVNYAIVVILGARIVMGGGMDIGTLTVYLDKSKSYGTPIAQIASCYSTLVSAMAGAERVFEILDTPSETDEGRITLVRLIKNALGEDEEAENEGAFAWKIPEEDGSKYVPLRGDIKVDDITFSYVEGTEVLKNVSVNADSGTKVAFVGSTGAGKTTITNLINRFYEIDKGTILYDGIDIKDIKKADLRKSMAMVLQDTRLFAGTIADNIRYGKLDATDEEVIEAAKIANAHSFIERLPKGYETDIRSDGNNISMGQAQLINIARAAIAKAPVLILDEATSSVDTRTERLIEVGMDSIMEERTVFVIAHRLSTVRNSEKIIVLEKGEIIEEGNHQSLIDLGGKYYQLYTGAFEMK